MIGKNSKYLIAGLAAVLVIGMSFALIPVQRASTVHTTITADTQTNANDQERAITFALEGTIGVTAITDAVLIRDNNVVLVGRIEATELAETDGGLGGSPDLSFECVNTDASVSAVGVALTAPNVKTSAALSATCESVRFDVAAGGDAGDAFTVLVTIYIDNWPEV